MKKNYYLLFIVLLCSVSIRATSNPIDSTAAVKRSKKVIKSTAGNVAPLQKAIAQNKMYRVLNAQPDGSARTFDGLDHYATDFTLGTSDDVGEFSKKYINEVFKTDQHTDSIIQAVKNLFNEINQHDKFIEKMTGNELIRLPVGIKKNIVENAGASSNTSISIGVVKAKIFPEYSELDLFAKLEIGELNTVLFFGASGVKLSHKGGIYGDAKLNLLADVPVSQNGGQWLLTFKGGVDDSSGSADGKTHIVIDCEGNVKEVAIAVDVRIAKTIAVPIKADGSYLYPNDLEPGDGTSPVNNKSYVGAEIRVVVPSLDDLLVEIDLPRFELKKLPKWGFQMKQTVFDLSDTRNALEKINFPPIYKKQQLLIPDNETLWRGFYAKEIRIILPPEFSKKDTDERVSVGAKNLIIDNFGVSGSFYAKDVLHFNEGTANKWQFSVEELLLDLEVNHFVKAKFSGKIALPVTTLKDSTVVDSKGKDSIIKHGGLKYTGLITADRLYSLRVDTDKNVDFSVFKSKAKLFKDSYIKLEVQNNKFHPEANLTGLMSFNNSQETALDSLKSSSDGIEELKFEGLSFQNFKIQTNERPYLHIEYIGYKDSVSLPKFYGFELGFYDMNLRSDNEEDQVELGFNSYVHLDKSGISGNLRMRVIGELIEGDYLQWKYKTFQVDSVEVDVKRKSFEFKGKLHFFKEQELYGKGLGGKLQLYAESLGLEMSARGIFGNTNDYRFWYVDTYGHPTKYKNETFKIYDIGGGVYHHMRKAGVDEKSNSMSGIYYMPDRTVDFGFKALAAFEVKKSSTFTGLVGVEMSFNTHGGVNRLGFYGAGSLMTGNSNAVGGERFEPFGDVESMQKTVSDKEQSLNNFHEISIDKEGVKYFANNVFPDLLTGKELFAAQVAINFDFTNDTYWGMFDAFLNAGAIKGDGEKNRLGYLEFYNAPEDWYIYVGTPSNRFGVREVPIGVVDARMNLYFMTGSILPPAAAPPNNVIQILDLKGNELVFGRNFEEKLALGQGYAFGAEFAIGKDFDWGIVYASVEAGVGFDLMMKNFGEAYCRGSEDRVGIDGWYATGQVYAFLQGGMGVKINIFGTTKKIRILEAGIATLAQAQLPNPWFVKGYSGIKIRALGMVTVKARLKIIIGEECELIGKTGLQSIAVISDMSPSDKATDTDVFDAVQVAFNVAVNEEVVVEEDSGAKTYKVALNEFMVKEDGNEISGTLVWNTQKDLLLFESIDVLPPEKEITARVKVTFEEKIDGTWKPVTDDNGAVLFEEKTVNFTTGKAPEKIPLGNIVFMYPVKDQQYFLPEESNKGYVQLKKGQDYLFGGSGFQDELFYIDGEGQSQKANFSYDKEENQLHFDIPNLDNQEKYTYKLTTNKSGQDNNQDLETTELYTHVNEDVSISNNVISQDASGKAEYVRLTYDFNTSKYQTFEKKMRRLDITNYYTLMDGSSDVGAMGLELKEEEPFGINDIQGSIYTANMPLIKAEAILTDFYFTDRIYPLIYQNYPLDKDIYANRDESILGTPPVRSIKVSNAYHVYANNTPYHHYLKKNFPFRWHLAHAYKRDFLDIQYKIVNRYLNTTPVDPSIFDQYGYIINGIFPYLEKEYYKVKLEYILPNKSSGNTSVIKYRNDF